MAISSYTADNEKAKFIESDDVAGQPGVVVVNPDGSLVGASVTVSLTEFPAASAAFQDYVDQYGDTAPNGPEARYWLGETLFIRGSYADAASAYIGAIRGWPPTVWGAEAVVKLSMSLVELNRIPDACRTLDEFGRRYPAAAPATKARADKARLRAKCT